METNLSTILKNSRKQKGISQKELSELTGIPHQIISRYEKGQELPTFEKLEVLYNVLNVNIEQLERIENEINLLLEEYIDNLFYKKGIEKDILNKITENEEEYKKHYNYYKILLIKMIIDIEDVNKTEEVIKIIKQIYNMNIEDKKSMQLFYDYVGYFMVRKKKTIKGIEYLNYAKSIYYDEKIIAMINFHLCFALNFEVIRETNQKVLIDAMATFQNYQSYQRVADCLMIQGNYYSARRYFEDAINSYKKAEEIYKIIKKSDIYVRRINKNIASVNIDRKRYVDALDYLNQVYQFSKKNEEIYLYYVICYYNLGNINEANHWITKANYLELKKEIKMKLKLFNMLILNYEKKPTDCIIEQALKIVNYYEKLEHTDLIIFYLDILIELYEQVEDYKNAFYYQKRKIFLLESL